MNKRYNSPCWAFCGGLFSGNVKDIIIFANHAHKIFHKMISDGYITWEVNVWMEIYNKYPNLFEWYEADHTIEMLSKF